MGGEGGTVVKSPRESGSSLRDGDRRHAHNGRQKQAGRQRRSKRGTSRAEAPVRALPLARLPAGA